MAIANMDALGLVFLFLVMIWDPEFIFDSYACRKKDYITAKGRQKGAFCRGLMADVSKRLDMTLGGSHAVKRGETIAKEAGCHLDD